VRLNLYWRGIDIIDLEVHVLRPRPVEVEDCGCGDETLAASGGQFELADDLEAPDTRVRVGFR